MNNNINEYLLHDDNIYFIIIIILSLLIIIFGGPNKLNYLVEYDKKNFKYIDKLSYFNNNFKYLIKNNETFEDTIQYKYYNQIIPNLLKIDYISLKPHEFYNFNKFSNSNILMIIYNHNSLDDNNHNSLKLLIRTQNKCNNINKCIKYGFFYNLINKISIVNIFPIYNDSNKIINLSIYIIKKSFWFY